jgi:hypothetical protein
VCKEKFLLAKKHIPYHKWTVSRDFSKIREDIRNATQGAPTVSMTLVLNGKKV